MACTKSGYRSFRFNFGEMNVMLSFNPSGELIGLLFRRGYKRGTEKMSILTKFQIIEQAYNWLEPLLQVYLMSPGSEAAAKLGPAGTAFLSTTLKNLRSDTKSVVFDPHATLPVIPAAGVLEAGSAS